MMIGSQLIIVLDRNIGKFPFKGVPPHWDHQTQEVEGRHQDN